MKNSCLSHGLKVPFQSKGSISNFHHYGDGCRPSKASNASKIQSSKITSASANKTDVNTFVYIRQIYSAYVRPRLRVVHGRISAGESGLRSQYQGPGESTAHFKTFLLNRAQEYILERPLYLASISVKDVYLGSATFM